jgi:hypothetical protein
MAKDDTQEKPARQRSELLPAKREGDSLETQHKHAVYEPISGASSVEAMQAVMGNELVLEALSGESEDAFASLIGGEISESITSQGSGSGALQSNTAMLKIMRDASVDWEDPALQQLNQQRGGRSLPAEKLNRFNAAFQHDFSHVRIHDDAAAARAADALNAHAFALGAHIFFGKGGFGDGAAADRLLAHELTHVVQHDEGRLPSSSNENDVSNPSDPSEQEAYANEVRVMNKLAVVDTEVSDHEASVDSVGFEELLSETEHADEEPSLETWGGFGEKSQNVEIGGDGEGESVGFGGLAMRKKDSLGADQTSDERVLKLIRQSRGGPIPAAVAERMGRAMGEDVSEARIHTDSAAAEAASLLNARAFALGADVFFGAGEYAPGTDKGDHVFAHELAHVVQHQDGRLPSGDERVTVSDPSDMAEKEAEAVATEAVSAVEAPEFGDVQTVQTDGGVSDVTGPAMRLAEIEGIEDEEEEEAWEELASRVIYFSSLDPELPEEVIETLEEFGVALNQDQGQHVEEPTYKVSIFAWSLQPDVDVEEGLGVLTGALQASLESILAGVESVFEVGESGLIEAESLAEEEEEETATGEPAQYAVSISLMVSSSDGDKSLLFDVANEMESEGAI